MLYETGTAQELAPTSADFIFAQADLAHDRIAIHDEPSPIDLIEPEVPHLRRFARNLTRNSEEADDLVQDCLVKAIQNIDKWQPGTNMRAWLMTILRNTFYNGCRRLKTSREATTELTLNAANSVTAPNQEVAIELKDVAAAYEKLSHNHREILGLVVIEGMDYAQAAEVLGVKMGTVKSRLGRARAELQRLANRTAA